MTLIVNLRCFASQLVRVNSFVLTGRRNLSSKGTGNEGLKPYEEVEDAEEVAAREAEIEKKRNKSNLFPDDYNRQHDRPPYDEPLFEFHESLMYRRRLYGKYGKSSNVNPSILWPSKIELDEMKEYERVAQPFTVRQLIKKVQEAKKLEEQERKEAETNLLKKVAGVESEIEAFHKRAAELERKVQEVIAKRNKLIEKVRKHFGYNISVKDTRFKEMLAEMEKEEKKQAKAAKKLKHKAKVTEFLEARKQMSDAEDGDSIADKEEK